MILIRMRNTGAHKRRQLWQVRHQQPRWGLRKQQRTHAVFARAHTASGHYCHHVLQYLFPQDLFPQCIPTLVVRPFPLHQTKTSNVRVCRRNHNTAAAAPGTQHDAMGPKPSPGNWAHRHHAAAAAARAAPALTHDPVARLAGHHPGSPLRFASTVHYEPLPSTPDAETDASTHAGPSGRVEHLGAPTICAVLRVRSGDSSYNGSPCLPSSQCHPTHPQESSCTLRLPVYHELRYATTLVAAPAALLLPGPWIPMGHNSSCEVPYKSDEKVTARTSQSL